MVLQGCFGYPGRVRSDEVGNAMPKKNGAKTNRTSDVASVLTQKDADRFKVSARDYGKTAASTTATARSKLQGLGIYTTKGRLTKKYA